MRLAVVKKASLEASVLDISLKPLVRQRCYQRCVHHLPGATYPQFGHCSTVVSHVNHSRWSFFDTPYQTILKPQCGQRTETTMRRTAGTAITSTINATYTSSVPVTLTGTNGNEIAVPMSFV